MLTTLDELQTAIKDVLQIDTETVTILNPFLLQESLIDKLIFTAIFSDNEEVKILARQLIKKTATAVGIISCSIRTLYLAIGKGEVSKQFTVPAMNIRTLTYDTARIIFRLAKEKNIGPFVFEISPTEMNYTHQQPESYAVAVLAAAIKEGHQGPVFLQGDHYQFHLSVYKERPDEERERLKKLIDESIAAHFYNIDIDASTLVDLTQENLDDQQKENYENTALLTKYIREKQPQGEEISIGAEIGHIGDRNSTVGDLKAFMTGFVPLVDTTTGISKIAIQTGTSHGGIPLADGTVAKVDLDFTAIKELGKVAREEYHTGGVVQHGASTLSNDMFHLFTENQTLEIHLATGFQNIVFQNLPTDLRQKMYGWIDESLLKEKGADWTEDQFIYKLRKKSLGQFEKDLWILPDTDKKVVIGALEKELRFLFEKLGIFDTKEFVDKYISPSLANPNESRRGNLVENNPTSLTDYLTTESDGITTLPSVARKRKNEFGTIKTIADEKIENKKVLLRVDFDVSLNPNHTIANDTRITQTLPTIQQLLANSNKLIIASHLGRPEGRDENFSLKPVVSDLQKYVPDYSIVLVNDFLSEEGKLRLRNQQPNEIMMLENTRFYPGEKKNDDSFAQQLASLADVYVNDAFAVCHRYEASVVGVPKFLPHYAGLLLQKEINAISHVLQNPEKPIVAIIGGAKTSDKLPLLFKLTEIADYLLLGGGIASTFLKAAGYEIGMSLIEEEQDEEVKKILQHAKDKKTMIILPRDVICAKEETALSGEEFAVNHIPKDQAIYDIGAETQALFGSIIEKAHTIIWNGPVGYMETPTFARGTEFLYYAITQNDHAFSVVGGGDTLNAISKKEYLDKITHISTGGGAMLEFIEKGTLPGIEALR